MIPEAGTPLDNSDIVRMLTALAASGDFVLLVTEGKERKGTGVINVLKAPPGHELEVIQNSALALPHTHQVHALYAGDLITMNGSHQA